MNEYVVYGGEREGGGGGCHPNMQGPQSSPGNENTSRLETDDRWEGPRASGGQVVNNKRNASTGGKSQMCDRSRNEQGGGRGLKELVTAALQRGYRK